MTGRALPESTQAEVDLHPSQGGTRENSDRVREMVTLESIVLPSRSQTLTIAKVRKTREMEIPEKILIEPRELEIKGAYVARVISKTPNASGLREREP
jgi:hypothetical protein